MADSAPSHISQHWAQFPHTPSPKASPCTVEPPESVLRETKNNPTGGRLPTPIYGHFQQSIDAKMDMGGDSETQHLRSQQEIDYELYVLRRRLPTPIEEDEAMDSCTGGSEDGMTFLARDCVGQGIDPSLETSHEVLRSSENRSSYGSLSETPRSSIPPPRSTRMSFSMGVRANCDLCQRRVPGHSNHIFRS